MAKVKIIEAIDVGPKVIVNRYPAVGSGEIQIGDQLIVRESQQAVFFRDGKSYDTMGAGRHTLTTMNIPLLSTLLQKFITEGSPFKAEVYFVNMKPIRDLKWGTSEPIIFRDSELSMVRLRSFGIFSMRVEDPVLFVNKVVGVEGRFEEKDIEGFLRSMILARMNDVLGEVMKTVLDLAALYDELSAALKSRVSEDFNKYGIQIVDFYINAITPPPEVQKLIDERSGMSALGNLDQYYKFKAAQAMEKAAETEGSAMGEGLGLGAGLGMGMQMMNMTTAAGAAAGAEMQRSTTTEPCPKCNTPMPTGSTFCPNCGHKVSLPDDTIISCSSCGEGNPPTAKFCSACGTTLEHGLHCPECGAMADDEDVFCSECGHSMK